MASNMYFVRLNLQRRTEYPCGHGEQYHFCKSKISRRAKQGLHRRRRGRDSNSGALRYALWRGGILLTSHHEKKTPLTRCPSWFLLCLNSLLLWENLPRLARSPQETTRLCFEPIFKTQSVLSGSIPMESQKRKSRTFVLLSFFGEPIGG